MKLLLILNLFLLPFAGNKDNFASKMEAGLQKLEKAQTTEALTDLGTHFAQIAEEHPEKWQPAYYEALCLVTAAFEEVNPTAKAELLPVADKKSADLLEAWPNNAEVWTLRAMFYSAVLMSNPAKAPQVSPMIESHARRALQIESTNPRAKFMLLSNAMGKASFFGQDVAPYCQQARADLEAFDTFQSDEAFAPVWGKEQLIMLASTCK